MKCRTGLPVLLLAVLLGCTPDKKKENPEIDRLWRAGYGYNNPNPQKKEGKPPMDFDGSVHQ